MKKFIEICFLLIFAFVFITLIIHQQLGSISKKSEHESNGLLYRLHYDEKLKEYEEKIKKLTERLANLQKSINDVNIDSPLHVKIPILDETQKHLSEIDVYSYSAFTYDKLFASDTSLYKRNVEKLTGTRLVSLHSIVSRVLEYLNNLDNTEYTYQLNDFQIGFYRVTPFEGYEYKLYFKKNSVCCNGVQLNQPLNTFEIKKIDKSFDSNKEVINFIVPLWGGERVNNLIKFMSIFETVALKQDNYMSTLTIVYMFKENTENETTWRNTIKKFLSNFRTRTNYESIKLIIIKTENYSRAKALQIGVEECCTNDNSLLLFCDVDIVFSAQFLDLCRFNTELNKKVYYPILFSFYNSKIISDYTQKDSNYSTASNFVINKDSGFWRDFGFGMTCQYKSDFLSINGFNDVLNDLNVWGDEDLYLYRKYVNSNLEIVRAITPGIFHLYHEKDCNQNELNIQQYAHCLESKVLTEASHKHFGFKYFNFTLPIINKK